MKGIDSKKAVTKRWVEAMDYLIFKGIEKNYKTFSENVGILYQRILEYNKFVKEEGQRSAYVSTEHIIQIHERYGVSVNFVLLGKGEMIESGDENKSAGKENYTAEKPVDSTEERLVKLEKDLAEIKEMLFKVVVKQ